MRKIIPLIIALLMISSVSALCDVNFVNYHGACTDDGDLRVVDSNGEVLIEQLYTVNRGCYQGSFHIAVPGGNDCQIKGGDQIDFQISGIKMGSTTWSDDSKVVEINLERPQFKEPKGDLISTTMLYFIITVMALLVVIITIIEFFRKRK